MSDSEPFRLTKREDAPVLPGSTEMDALAAFRAAARRLDAAEKELAAARIATAEAVGRLREEAVK